MMYVYAQNCLKSSSSHYHNYMQRIITLKPARKNYKTENQKTYKNQQENQ